MGHRIELKFFYMTSELLFQFLNVFFFLQADDINSAFEGTRKAQNSFSAYLSGIGRNKMNGALVKKVLDFSFHDVKGLLQLIRHSLESINHE
jgi:hypothetical protein